MCRESCRIVLALDFWFCLRFLEFSRNRLAAHELPPGGTWGYTHFLGSRMNCLAAGQESPGAELLIVVFVCFDWFVSTGNVQTVLCVFMYLG